jgi:hypothetical protein
LLAMLTNLPALADRFAWMIQCLCKQVAAEGCKLRIEALLVTAIWTRVSRLGRRFASVVARLRAGKLPAPGTARRRCGTRAGAPRPPSMLPQIFGFVQRLMPETTPYAGALHALLQTPEMAALVAEAPQAGRVLRPLCRTLGVTPPAYLALPRRPQVRRPRAAPEKRVVPVETSSLSRPALARLLHPLREPIGLRPPDSIGYGRAPPIPG